MRLIRILLVIIAVVCIGVAVSYPIRYRQARDENNTAMDELSAMRAKARQEAGIDETAAESGVPITGGAVGADEEDVSGGIPAQSPEEANAVPDGGATGDHSQAVSDAQQGANPDVQTGQEAPSGTEAQGGAEIQAGTEAQSGASSDSGTIQGGEPSGQASGGERSNAEPSNDEPMGGQAPNAEPVAGETLEPDEPTPVPTPTPEPTPEPTPTPVPTPVANPDLWLLRLEGWETPKPTPGILEEAGIDVSNLSYTPTPEPSPTPVWDEYTGPLPYPMLEKVELDEHAILPELREIYALNHDLVGWINIPGTVIDYPVVQCKDSDYYLEHDFYGNKNINGQIILDTLCDPYTPSYNLILSGHHMKNGSMFGDLPEYRVQSYWEKHKFLEFDTLMERKLYIVFAAFYSADYDEDEEGFRYNANIQYNMEAKHWLQEIRDYQLYDTGIDVAFGDEFITLTTCNRARHRNGRFVVVCRKIREGETFE